MKVYSAWKSRLVLADSCEPLAWIPFCRDIDDTLMSAKKIFKSDNTSTVWLAHIQGLPVVVKKIHSNTWAQKLRRCCKKSRPWRNWVNAEKLKTIGISSITPLAVKETWWGPFHWGDSYLICTYIEGVSALHLLAEGSKPTPEWPLYISKMIQLMGRLKSAKMSHRDLNPSNLLWAGREWVLLDLDAMREHSTYFLANWYFRREQKRFLNNWADVIGKSSLLMPLIFKNLKSLQ